MSVSVLDHYTLRCVPADLPPLLDFYTRALDLVPGERPVMPFPGYWLYSGDRAVVHLFASQQERQSGSTGSVDHISFRAHDLAGTQAGLRAKGIPFEEMALPDHQVHQIFLRDPFGLKVELTFYLREERAHPDGQPA
jgi:catechol 2,3-dioxygenase-like lactoylglutathione lyase family enzyme